MVGGGRWGLRWCEWESCEACQMAARRLMSLCPDSKRSVGSGGGNACAPLPGCPRLDAQATARSWGRMA